MRGAGEGCGKPAFRVIELAVAKELVGLRIPAKHQPDLSGLPDNTRVMDPGMVWVMAFEPEPWFVKRGG